MSEFDGLDSWHCLVRVAELVSEGKLVLEQFVKETEEPCTHSDALVLGFIKKGKRSPRKKRVVFVPSHESLDQAQANARSGQKIRLRIIFNSDDLEEIAPDVVLKIPSSRNPRKRRMNYGDKEGVSRKRAKKRSAMMDPAPDLPETFKNRILETGGDVESVVLVVQKALTKTDVSTGHGRLSVHYSKVRTEFLKLSEADELDKEKGRVRAILVQPCLDECGISLRNWKSNSEYALVHDWNRVCSINGLKEGMKIQLWSFRKNSELCFALVQLS